MRISDWSSDVCSSDLITSSKAIAEVTGLSPSSIDNYLSRAAVALGEPDRLSAAKRFVELERLAAQNSVSRSVSRFSRVFRAIFLGKRSFAAGVRWLLRVPPIGGRQHRLNRIEIHVRLEEHKSELTSQIR